jgi:polyphenol oxidase
MIPITSTKLSYFNNLRLFMSTKNGGVSPPPLSLNLSFSVGDSLENVKQNRKIFFNSIGVPEEKLAIQKQTHSNNVQIIYEPGVYQDCDALITNKKDVFLTVTVADCVPIFLYDSLNCVIALVHSGWKGTANKILTKTIETLLKDFESKPENIFAFIGPSASKCCYEVDENVSTHFDTQFLTDNGNSKFKLDLKGANISQLIGLGIPDDNIEVSQFCTICYPEIFHSYRRDGNRSGRMIGVLGLTG